MIANPPTGMEYFVNTSLRSGDICGATGAAAEGAGICTTGPDPVVVRAPVDAGSRLAKGELDGAGTWPTGDGDSESPKLGSVRAAARTGRLAAAVG